MHSALARTLLLIVMFCLVVGSALAQENQNQNQNQDQEAQQQAGQAEKKADDAQDTADDAQDTATQAQDTAEQTAQAIDALTKQVADLKDQLAELQKLNTELQTAIDDAEATGSVQTTQLVDLSKQIKDLNQQIEASSQEIADQEKVLTEHGDKDNELDKAILSINNQVQVLQDQLPDSTLQAAWEKRLAKLETSVDEIPEIPTDVVEAGAFPGSFTIPGTDAALKIGGQVRTSLIRNLDPLNVDDRFLTAGIPVGESDIEAGRGPRVNITAKWSRFNFDMRAPTDVGSMRAFIEADFGGDGNTLRLRHAYGQYWKLLIGQTWSTLVDLRAVPEELDFEGLNAKIQPRQAQVRFNQVWDSGWNLAVAMENPSPEITGTIGVSKIPDIIVRTFWNFKRLHVQAAVVLRQIIGQDPSSPSETVTDPGAGVCLSGRIPLPFHEKENLKFQVNFGRALGHYINDLRAEGGQDAVFDTTNGTMETLKVFSCYTGYQHWWSANLRSTGCLGYVWVDNLDYQGPTAYHETFRLTLNLLWSPTSRVDLGVEFLWGRRENMDRQYGTATQIQVGAIFRW